MALEAELDGARWLRQLSPGRPTAEGFSATFPHRLGNYYEQVVNHILILSGYFVDIKRNIQVFDGRRTVGEFDFLLRDRQQQVHHLECAIKFYLCVGAGDRLSDYIGPGRRDRLDLKWHKMRSQQIELAYSQAGRQRCQELGLVPSRYHLLIQGMLFYRWGDIPTQLAPELSPQHSRGWWLARAESSRLLADCDAVQIRRKPDWLSHWCRAPEENWRDQLEVLTGPQLFSRLVTDGDSPTGWREKDRGFIVPDEWQALPL
ncbi:DUF1853 family protein [Marinobacterium sp. CAU 1594]|nr:DUF1853 family protein [Marinobacterium arenosum]